MASRSTDPLGRPEERAERHITILTTLTRNECGDSRNGSPASLSRRLTRSQIRFDVIALLDSSHVRPLPTRNNSQSLFSPFDTC